MRNIFLLKVGIVTGSFGVLSIAAVYFFGISSLSELVTLPAYPLIYIVTQLETIFDFNLTLNNTLLFIGLAIFFVSYFILGVIGAWLYKKIKNRK